MTAQTPPRPTGRALRTVVVSGDLDELRGPLTGRYRLPHHLDASARHLYDLADEQWRELPYRTVLMDAGNDADVADWAGEGRLARAVASAAPPFVRAPGLGAPACPVPVPAIAARSARAVSGELPQG